MLGSKKAGAKAAWFLRKSIGRPAKPYVKSCVKKSKSATARKRCATLSRQIR